MQFLPYNILNFYITTVIFFFVGGIAIPGDVFRSRDAAAPRPLQKYNIMESRVLKVTNRL